MKHFFILLLFLTACENNKNLDPLYREHFVKNCHKVSKCLNAEVESIDSADGLQCEVKLRNKKYYYYFAKDLWGIQRGCEMKNIQFNTK